MRVLRATFLRRTPPSLLIFFAAQPVLLTLDNQSSVAGSPDPFSRHPLPLFGVKTSHALFFSLSLSHAEEMNSARSLRRPLLCAEGTSGKKNYRGGSEFFWFDQSKHTDSFSNCVSVFVCCRLCFLSLFGRQFLPHTFLIVSVRWLIIWLASFLLVSFD